MSNTTTTIIDPFIVKISYVQKLIGIYSYLIIFLLGNFGSFFNVLILGHRNYRKNSCSNYILASSCVNIVIINIVVFFRFLSSFDIDPATTSSFFCKFRTYIAQMMSVLSRCYILLACIDRWAMTSSQVQRRAFARLKISNILIPIIAIIFVISFLHVPFFQDIVKGKCVVISTSYTIFNNTSNIIFTGILIPFHMLLFSLLTIRNVKQLRQRAQNPLIKTNYEYQLVLMVAVQQLIYLISSFPFVSYLIYDIFTMNTTKSSVQSAIDGLYMTIVYMLRNINFSATFYIYLLTSSVFRKRFKQLIIHNRLVGKCFGNDEGS